MSIRELETSINEKINNLTNELKRIDAKIASFEKKKARVTEELKSATAVQLTILDHNKPHTTVTTPDDDDAPKPAKIRKTKKEI
jgi:phage-related minor tail protein